MTATFVQQSLLSAPQHVKTSDDYYTPAWVFERMGIRFDLDVCSPPGGIPWIPADHYFTMEDDGLAQEWHGRVWMNPPFSGSAPWVDRFIAHGDGVCLVPHSRARWHGRLWDSGAAMVDPNNDPDCMFQFLRDGVPTNIYMPVFLAAFGDECVEAIGRLGRVR
jgi:hypothetical protein